MSESSLGDLSITAFLDAIGSQRVSPGAGAAGAVALALAAACATKAACISLRHSAGNGCLIQAIGELQSISSAALRAADRDAQAFREFTHAKTSAAAENLIGAGQMLAHLIEALRMVIDSIEPHVKENMRGDLFAARALAGAARTIESANEAQTANQPQI
jgi:hypothetical protein